MLSAGLGITRRGFIGGLTASLAAALAPSSHAQRRPPNIVLILVDDLGWRDVACYGGAQFETPNIDRLAAEGMRFTDAYANCPVCSPSRAAIMTGQYPARVGFTGHITAIGRHRYPDNSRIIPPEDHFDLPYSETTIAEALKKAGYATASIGKWHLGREGYWPEAHGFDVNAGGWTHGSPPNYFDPYKEPKKEWNASIPTLEPRKEGEYLTDRLTGEAIQFMEAQRDNPFFVYLTHYGVHTPLQAPKELVAKYRKKLDGADTGTKAAYAAMVENMDMNVGRVVDAVEQLGLSDDTIIVFTSDNGGLESSSPSPPLRAGKGALYEAGIRVPLIVKWPGRIEPGTTCREPVIGCDLYPTCANAAAAGDHMGEAVDGMDLMPLLRGADSLDREAIYWYYPHYHSQSMRPGAAIRNGDYKLIETYDPPQVELYNLVEDVGERHDLSEKLPEKTAELLSDLRNHVETVCTIPHTLRDPT